MKERCATGHEILCSGARGPRRSDLKENWRGNSAEGRHSENVRPKTEPIRCCGEGHKSEHRQIWQNRVTLSRIVEEEYAKKQKRQGGRLKRDGRTWIGYYKSREGREDLPLSKEGDFVARFS